MEPKDDTEAQELEEYQRLCCLNFVLLDKMTDKDKARLAELAKKFYPLYPE